jgi:ribose-phosphate pyrophosphokinase
MIKFTVGGKEIPFTTTIFPDGTSQVWKLDDSKQQIDAHKRCEILWMFENESELFHICQLATLLDTNYDVLPTLVCPYLPYARQDKTISNTTSFALTCFISMVKHSGINEIETFDAHSSSPYVVSTYPTEFHSHILSLNMHDMICYPDKGALDRYAKFFNKHKHLDAVVCEKIRQQSTGDILGLRVMTSENLDDKRILIVDDICDGGMTFIKVAEALRSEGATGPIDLVVSHGLFSKGKQVLHDAGIANIFTTNSLLRNPEGFKVV